jgi:hypothetical protein
VRAGAGGGDYGIWPHALGDARAADQRRTRIRTGPKRDVVLVHNGIVEN